MLPNCGQRVEKGRTSTNRPVGTSILSSRAKASTPSPSGRRTAQPEPRVLNTVDDRRLHGMRRVVDETVREPRIDSIAEASHIQGLLQSSAVMSIVTIRLRTLNESPVRPERAYVLYWMTASRRTRFNWGLEHAVAQANALGKPLVIFEALRVGYPYANERMHQFVLDGMRDNAAACAREHVTYWPYLEPQPGAGRGLLLALARDAVQVVTDDSPQFFLPKMRQAAARQLDVRLDAVDSVGLMPRAALGRAFASAHALRSRLQKELPAQLQHFPDADPLADLLVRTQVPLPADVRSTWPLANAAELTGSTLTQLPLDHTIRAVQHKGGSDAGTARLHAFMEERLAAYPEDRNHPDLQGSSGLSPYLHFGHTSAHEVFLALAEAEDWHPGKLGPPNRGAREGWWGMSPAGEAFVDQLVTWRELGHLEAEFTENYDAWSTLPTWAQHTLDEHARDPRPVTYTLAQLRGAATHDPLWNAAQRQLVADGTMHNYLRMLWGKKILEWSPTPQEALARMLELNDRFALDGRDPNSVAGIFWVLGRYDRPWGPVRPIFGTIRYMTSANTARKWHTTSYVARWAAVRQFALAV